MSHLPNKSSNPLNGRPTPEVADKPIDNPAVRHDLQRDQLDDVAVFRAFLKRNLISPPPPVPSDLLGKILDRIDAVDAETTNK